MHEYEFRLVVQDSYPFDLRNSQLQIVYYIKPHFRFRNGKLEEKRVQSTQAVYHDGLWFKWVHSIEVPFESWSLKTNNSFLHNVGNYQDPVSVQTRQVIIIDSRTQLYTFQASVDTYRLVFEWEYGTFPEPLPDNTDYSRLLLESLNQYKYVYDKMRGFCSPPYKLNETLTRKSVKCTDPEKKGELLYAHKLDGTFGLVYSYRDRIKEKWEGYECVVRRNVSLGDGLVFGAERLEDGRVYLLDVYHVRGHDTAHWCRKGILTEFLPQLELLVDGYFVQVYVSDPAHLSTKPPFQTDGLIIHNIEQDVIYKCKSSHSIDLVYYKGYFQLPNGGKIKCTEKGMEDGCVYEISTKDGKIIRKRTDRFKGNTTEQLENVLKYGWHGPPIMGK